MKDSYMMACTLYRLKLDIVRNVRNQNNEIVGQNKAKMVASDEPRSVLHLLCLDKLRNDGLDLLSRMKIDI